MSLARLRRSVVSQRFLFLAIITTVSTLMVLGPAFADFHNRILEPSRQLQLARASHTATLLANGEIFIVGGEANGQAVAESEFVHPDSLAVRMGARLAFARAEHSASLLADGRLLVAGGRDAAGALASAEMFDPQTGLFSLVGRMGVARVGHTAAQLPNGDLLITGGDAGGTAEIFRVATSSFTPVAAPMSSSRRNPSSVTLQDGRVLVVGGTDGQGRALKSAELFDPFTGRFLPVGEMRSARVAPTLRLLPDGKVQVIAGQGLVTMEMFNPRGYFTAEVRLPKSLLKKSGNAALESSPSSFGSSAALSPSPRELTTDAATKTPLGNGRTLRVGGHDASGRSLRNVEILSDTIEAWVTTDKTDYPPGEMVTITGGGFLAGETISIELTRDPQSSRELKFTAVADASGNFINTDFWTIEDDLNTSFLVVATGVSSGREAFTAFTDGATSVGSVSLSPTSASVAAPGTASYDVTVARGTGAGSSGAFDADLTISALPAGVSASFSPSQLNYTSTQSTKTSILTLTVSAGAAAGTVNFTVTATNAGTPGNFDSAAGTLVVTVTCTAPTVSSQPTAQSIIYGSDATFTAAATGSPAPTVQWQVNTGTGFTNIGGATSTILTVTAPAVSQSGSTYRAVFTNACGGTSTATSNSATLTVAKATATITLSDLVHTYDNTAKSATATTSPAGLSGVSLTYDASATAPTNAGTYAVVASLTNDNYAATAATANLLISKASSAVTVTCPASVTYSGSALTPCTAAATGVGGLNESLSVSYTDNINAGNAGASASYAGGANHQPSSGSASFTIAKASSTVTVTCPASVTYTGSPLTPCTAAATGANLNVGLTVSYTDNINAGTAGASASYAGGDNHEPSNGSASFTIAKASSTVTVTCPVSVTYTGAAITPCSAAVTGAGGLNQALPVSYTNNINAGTAGASASYSGGPNHHPSNGSASFTIGQAPATVTYTGPLFISGTAKKNGGFTATVTSSATVYLEGHTIPSGMSVVFKADGATVCTASVGSIGGSNTTGTATCTWTATSNDVGITYTVTGTLQATNYVGVSEESTVNVSAPGTNFITGGGYLVLGTNSAGHYAGTPGTKANFGFNVKYNKSGTNLQGNLNVIVRQVVGGVKKVYQVKGNVLTQLSVKDNKATFNGKANMTDITDALNPVSLGGNLVLQLDMTDQGEPGTSDAIALTVYDGNGGLLFSSSWNGTKSQEALLAGGNLSVK